MLKNNKFILGILTFAISISMMSYSMEAKASASSDVIGIQLGIYDWGKVKNLPIHEAVDQNGITWGYQELSDGTLYIVYSKNTKAHMEVPSQLNGKTVSAIGDAVRYPEYKDYLTPRERMDSVLQSIKIPSTVKFIAPHAFNCANLTDVQLPATTWVSETAFTDTPWLEKQRNSQGLIIINNRLLDAENQSGNITIPSNVKDIADGAFGGQQDITSVTIPEGVTKVGDSAFIGCRNMKSIVLPNSITEIERCAFAYCSSLESITIPNSVTKIEETTFQECSNLKSITIPDSVKEIGLCAFSECSRLEKVKIYGDNIHLSYGAFENCEKLTEVQLPSNAYLEKNVFDGTPWLEAQKNSNGALTVNNEASNVNRDKLNVGNNTALTEKSASTTNNETQKPTVPQGWNKDGVYWNWLWSDGSKKTGWYNENGNWYYFYGNGQMATEFIDLGGFSYYFKPDSVDGKAAMVTGWQYIGGHWFYFNPNSDGYRGLMKRACWANIGGNWYYFYYDGKMARNTYINGYYVNSNGVWIK